MTSAVKYDHLPLIIREKRRLGGDGRMERIDLVMDRVLVTALLCVPFYIIYKFGLMLID